MQRRLARSTACAKSYAPLRTLNHLARDFAHPTGSRFRARNEKASTMSRPFQSVTFQVSLLHPGLDLVEAGLGASFVVGPAALLAVGAAVADRADEIVAGHDRQRAGPREEALVGLELGLERRVLFHVRLDHGGRLLHLDGDDRLLGAELGGILRGAVSRYQQAQDALGIDNRRGS